jgi:N-acetylmuramoyl-L-alanine amidase
LAFSAEPHVPREWTIQAHPRLLFLFAPVLATLILVLTLPAADEKQIAVYGPNITYSLPIIDRENREYIGLLEVLEPLGTVTSRSDGLHWKLRYNDVDAEFVNLSPRAKIHGHDFDLGANFLLEQGRGLIPVAALNYILPRILGSAVAFNPASRRLFVGNIATHFTAQLSRTTPPRLVMTFTAPVNPTIGTEPGRLRMTFNREPLVPPGSATLTFNDPLIPSATYSETNGVSEISVNGAVPLMASFSNDRRTITIAPTPQQVAAPPTPPAAAAVPPASTPSTPAAAVNPSITVIPPSRIYAVIDASHGGDDHGVTLNDKLAEKDVTLAIAHRIRQELEARNIPAQVIRDFDGNLSFDQRAILTNTAHPAIYIAVHAASSGKGVRLYTALLPAGGENNGPFIAWDTAQAGSLANSQAAAQAIGFELSKHQIQSRTLSAPLRPLNNVTAVAIAVEVAPPGTDVMDLTLPAYQQNVASAVATAIANNRDKLGAPR